ncbi:tol-pal system protein YbgF [Sedimenticola hydrogenitrophicus]|uniref:tol-pal system protein YbgF n=1 Tax=Sedimenticola hydrogenitrophicus TaxID=2967975 RepID=UPI0023AFD1D5|nr:tol-pal system protein YbgF [Sedimenticola hydrogenitrophicus]
MVTRTPFGLLVALFLIGVMQPALAQQRAEKLTPQQAQARQIELLERKLAAMADLVLRVDALQREVQQLRGEIEVQNHAMDALKKRQRDLYLDVDQRINQLAHGSAPTTGMAPPAATPPDAGAVVAAETPPGAPGTDAESGSAPPPAAEPPPVATADTGEVPAPQPALAAPIDTVAEERDYKAAFSLLMQRRYDEARSAFQAFLARYGAGGYADNAQYWLAEASYVTRDFDVALEGFQKVVNEYPNSSKVPDAMLKSSFIHYEKQQWSEARDILQRLVTLYPSSTASRLATQRLDRMQAEGH